jgi:RHS repeat-associated protein
MRTATRYFVLTGFLTLTITAHLATGQVSTGTPPYGSFGGGSFDTINLGNLNVHFSIPVLNKAGRGMPFTYDLLYDSSLWTPVTSNGVTQWDASVTWGWTSTSFWEGYLVSKRTITETSCPPPKTGKLEEVRFSWTYIDGLGTPHPFQGQTGDDSGCGSTQWIDGTLPATDDSGYSVTVVTEDGTETVTDRSGRTISPPVNTQSGDSTTTDDNGNQISANTSGQYFDTLSSTTPVLTVAGSGTPSSPVTFTYTGPVGSEDYQVNYEQYTVATNFGVSGITEYGPLSIPLISSITLPDNSEYQFTYEETPGSCTPLQGTYSTNCVTGRIASVTLPTGGSISYTYSGGSHGIESDGSTAGMTRTLSPGGEWQYSRSQVSGAHWQTTVTSPPDPVNSGSASDVTVIDFEEDGNTTTPTNNFYPTQQVVYQGSTSGTLLSTTITCYNGNGISSPSTCASTAVSSPISQTTVFNELPSASGQISETNVSVNTYGLNTEVDEYDYGSGAVGSLLRKTITSYATLGNGIQDRKATVTIENGSGTTVASTSYTYDGSTPTATTGTPQHISVSGSRGLLTSVAAQANGSTNLYRQYTYYDTGNLSTSTDVSTLSSTTCTSNPSSCTTYNYSSTGSCGNSFVTSISEPLGLSRSMTWNCTGGLYLSLTDENGNTSSTAYSGSNYSNVFWRPYSTTDNNGNTTNYFYYLNSSNEEFQAENKYASTFNSGASTVDNVATNDGFGRNIFQQTLQAPGGTTYDTVATCYDSFGRQYEKTQPYSASEATSNSQSCTGGAVTTYAYDALNRQTGVTDGGGGTTTYVFSYNDVLETLNSPSQSKQNEYDGLGRLKSVCEVTSGTTQFPSAACNQNTSATGYLTKYTYDLLGDITGVTQNAQASSGTQTRSYVYDMLGRLTSETTPETNNAAATYSYDSLTSDAACGTVTSAGNKLKRLDASGNATCYSGYDALHRLGNIIYPSTSTPASYFVYDAGTLNGTSMSNAKTRLAEAYTCTGTCSGKITDLFFSYSPTGQTTSVWELTPHSGTNTYFQVSSLFWPNGAIETLSNLSGLPTITYSTEGEGRMSTVTTNGTPSTLASSVGYDPSSHVTGYTFGSSDADSFTFYSTTGRMNTYTFSVGSSPQTDSGTLYWNSNGSLQQLVINDQLNSADSQTCNYTHDALGRVASANCGASTWSQTFSYDPFGNITKTVPPGATGISFQPTYDYTNYTNRITSSPFTDNSNNGDMSEDQWHSYGWDTENRVNGIDSGTSNGICETYDALSRVVEIDKGSACTTSPTSTEEVVYSPSGTKLALMNGSTLVKAFVPLPGGAQAVYNSSGLAFYRHPDWLGSSRLSTTSARQPYYDTAYAPFGENYAGSGTQDLMFTGQNQDTESSSAGGAGGLYDFLYREHSPVQGRWLSPDPAGLAAVNPNDPQSWNRYAYVGNRPTNSVDPLGLDCWYWGWSGYSEIWTCGDDDSATPMSADDDGGGGGGYGPIDIILGSAPFTAGDESVPPIQNTPTLTLGGLLSLLSGTGIGCATGASIVGFQDSSTLSNPCFGQVISAAAENPPPGTATQKSTTSGEYSCFCERVNWDPWWGQCGFSCDCNDDYVSRIVDFPVKGLRMPPCNAKRECPPTLRATKEIVTVDLGIFTVQYGHYTVQSCTTTY